MKEKVKNINFFKKVKYSITKFEEYPLMAAEGLKRAIKYLITLTAIVTIFVMIGSLLQLRTLITDFSNYVQNNIPEFTYKDGNFNVQSEEQITIDDIGYTGIDRVIINTNLETDEQKNQIENENLIEGNTIFLFKNEIILKSQSESAQVLRQSYFYNDFITNYTGEAISEFNKSEFINYLTSENMSKFYLQFGATMFVYLLIVNIIVALLDSLEIAILGWITTTIARIKMKFVAVYNMAIYSLTLSMILNILYIIINYFTEFTITYFQVAYITIAYIYLAATIFIIKDDILRKLQEVKKIEQEQLKVREEMKEEQKQDNKDKKDKNEDENGDEPQGSEV